MSVHCEYRTLALRQIAVLRFDPGWCIRDFHAIIRQIAPAIPVIYLLPEHAQLDGINLFGELRNVPDRQGFNAIVGLSDISRAFIATAAALTQRGIRIGFYRSLDDALADIERSTT